jgi:hypothetical protein
MANRRKPSAKAAEAPRVKPKVDPAFSDPAQNVRIVSSMRQLLAGDGWAILSDLLRGNIDLMHRQIVEKRGLDGATLTEAACDTLRLQASFAETMLAKPSELVEKLGTTDRPEAESDDPYA